MKLLFIIFLTITIYACPVYAGEIDKVFEIGREYGIDPFDLKAIAWVETEWTLDPLWDEGNGREYGLYCINIKSHHLTKVQAQDPVFATRWVCRYLNKKGYQKDRLKAIRRFNGYGKKARAYVRVVDKWAEKFKKEDKK